MRKWIALMMVALMVIPVCGCKPGDDSAVTTTTGNGQTTTTTTVSKGDTNTTTSGGDDVTTTNPEGQITTDSGVVTTTVPGSSSTTHGGNTTTTTKEQVSTTTTTKEQVSTTTTTVKQPVAETKTYTFDVPILSGDKTKKKLSVNPNRGFRLENSMSVENGKYMPDMYDSNGDYLGENNQAGSSISWMQWFYEEYEYEAPQIIQTYFYLTQYRDKDLDQKVFDNMNAYFEACRKMNITVAVRFAYVFNDWRKDDQDCVSLEQMLRHMEQLKPILAENRDVVFCLEGGFFGEWGEQSQSSSWFLRGDAGKIVDAAVEMVPDDVWVLCRYYKVWEQANAVSKKQLGFHNEYICGFSHAWDTGGNWDTEEYMHAKLMSSKVLFEGEMPWGVQLPGSMKDLNGWNVVKYLSDNHYTALSCYHNNREGGVTHDMKDWRSVTVTPALLDQYGLNYYPEWFKTADGKAVSRSLFDYLQQFLGYHLVSSDVTVTKTGTKADVSFSLTNYGFAAPLAIKAVKLVIMDSKGTIVDSQELCELVDLQARTTKDFNVTMTLPDAENVYRVGLWLENYNNVGGRLANDIGMVGEINLLGTMN